VLPPYQEDVLRQRGTQALPADGQWGPYVVTTGPTGKTWTRSCISPDGTVITEVCHEPSNCYVSCFTIITKCIDFNNG